MILFVDWSSYTPQKLQAPKLLPLQSIKSATDKGNFRNRSSIFYWCHHLFNFVENTPRGKNPLNKKMLSWAESKIDLAEVQKKCFLEQHALKLEIMKKEHEERLRLMNLESQARIEKIKNEK
jgi:hypothetical protein